MSGVARYRWFKCESRECRRSFPVDKQLLQIEARFCCDCGRWYWWDGRRLRKVKAENLKAETRNRKADSGRVTEDL